ncbi:proteinase [Sphaerisporangium siamense]|uniref:Pimeloyl-ACP methyl ester carboxylesterase n=1 Tax=Sphaerisporangium siamense TaxID=795645 RepID=A0A7W7D2W5_9ACTN|nr:alpha/beta hydrolase [Sphaerisporangium siamense]MBB4699330.1 pimeloyl-ACP methyl ester carboxylesterase [Sphaerisporangium siamense]GII89239.1 proteinase [Sphaerisporangium siamense]
MMRFSGVGRTATALLAAVSVATACSAQGDAQRPSDGSSPGDPPAASATQAPSAALAPFYTQKIAWTPCQDKFQCGKLTVPLDYADPGGERIQVSLIKLPASGNQRIGSILLNPGGPGGSGIEYARAARTVLSPAVLSRFDTVGFDPRGVGKSAPVRCLSGRELDVFIGLDGTPDDPSEVSALARGGKQFAEGCEARSAKLLPHVGTEDAARDMDVLRAALGDQGITYLGKSYGTYLGAVYADLFPKKIRALVLDGAIDPALPPVPTVNAAQAHGFEVAFRSFLADCFSQQNCPFPEKNTDAALGRLSQFLKNTDQHPLRNNTGDGRTISESWATLGILAALYDKGTWPVLRAALGQGFRGDGTTLLRLADLLIDRRPDGSYSNQTEANMAVNCVDHPYPHKISAYEEAAKTAQRESPHFGAYVMWGSLPCDYWPVKPTGSDRPLKAAGAPPIVVVGTERDPATPYQWAKSLASELSSGVLLSYDGDGHTAYRTGSPCVDEAVDRYLISLDPPRSGTLCPKVT